MVAAPGYEPPLTSTMMQAVVLGERELLQKITADIALATKASTPVVLVLVLVLRQYRVIKSYLISPDFQPPVAGYAPRLVDAAVT
ncbi:hypothetical protein [Xanthomonas campestris]|uniref:hypothetical protein n=2 Tax=Xanthomonas campestris TaxID=339 RepID=UPI00114CB12A|nr:hypothetical protein [Xanthomonas campestris]MEB1152402.1 hypothetical protein [Xanthomonas campestris pv. campestris]MCC5098564.1 hypothetical protein [Xanthomonas campestris]MEA9584392.1 hypothetical protein [Xanthomonas campestris]MEA9592820.1 hypothetical protein [Xanthomonas campestris]MEA9624577.1 hypothetical protein [Xanthomonas campestris]